MTWSGRGGRERAAGEGFGPSKRVRAVAAGLSATVVAAGAVIAGWVVLGPTGFVFAWITHCTLMAWVSVVLSARTGPLEHPWFRVGSWEPPCYAALGVRLYGRVLEGVGWNRVVGRDRGFDGTRAGLPHLDQHTRSSESGHLLCTAIASALAVAAVWAGEWVGALWLLGLGIVLHAYPVMLQRSLRMRIQALTGC